MFVTSDIFDLEGIAQRRYIWNWRERLVAGVGLHGTDYPGAEAAARFLIEAAEICGLQLEQLPVAGYSPRWGEPSDHVQPGAIAELARGALPAASQAVGVYLQGSRGSYEARDLVHFGGWVDAAPRLVDWTGSQPKPGYPYRAFDGDFTYPLDEPASERGDALLRAAANILGIDYGYFFVRDAFAHADFYARGPGLELDRSRLGRADALEVNMWRKFVVDGELWTGVWPQLRDIFAVNLLSERHMSGFIEPIGKLDEWITAEPGRGRLSDTGNGRVIWSLTDAEIHAVRPVLWDAAVMRSCMPRVYRDLPYARQRPDPEVGRDLNVQTSGT